MSQRNFPASFWNSSYHANSASLGSPSGHPDFSLSDPYMTASSLHSMSSLQDPWRYPLTSQSTHPYSHSAAAMHDLAYSSMAAASSASRFNSHYGSFLPSARLGAQCDLMKHSNADPWGSRYGESLSSAAAHHDPHGLHAGITGKYVSFCFFFPVHLVCLYCVIITIFFVLIIVVCLFTLLSLLSCL